jgi:hypothetical protein
MEEPLQYRRGVGLRQDLPLEVRRLSLLDQREPLLHRLEGRREERLEHQQWGVLAEEHPLQKVIQTL